MHLKDLNAKLTLIILCLIVFGASLEFSFLAWDDDVNIVQNTWFESGHFFDFLKKPYFGLYIPVPYLLWGFLYRSQIPPEPSLFHAVNLLIHCANTLQVFWLIHTLLKETRQESHAKTQLNSQLTLSAGIAASVFCIHPLQVEPVCWISGMRDLLSGFFSLLACHGYVRGQKSRSHTARFGFESGVIISSLLALLCKPQAIILPLLLWTLGGSLGPHAPSAQHRFSKAQSLSLLIWGTLLGLTLWVNHQAQSSYFVPPSPLINRPLLAIDALGFYVKKTLLPLQLSADYGRTPEQVMDDGLTLIHIVIFALTLAGLFCIRGRNRTILTGAQFFFLAFLPVLGLIPFGFQSTSTVADRYAYLPILGFSLLIGAILKQQNSKKLNLLALGLLAMTATLSFHRSSVWKEDSVFFTDMALKNPKSVSALLSLGNLKQKAGDSEEALRYFQRAHELKPDHPAGLANWALALKRLKKFDVILQKISPLLSETQAQSISPENRVYLAALYEAQGVALLEKGDHEKSRHSLCLAKALDPLSSEVSVPLQKIQDHSFKSTHRQQDPVPPPCPEFLRLTPDPR
ncbi:MAG: tetratricopeptide repeat protein [Bdellovibrionia bacterium]